MTPKEKAKDLFDSYYYCLLQSSIEKRNYWSKQSAIIAVDEILNLLINVYGFHEFDNGKVEYWQEVKQELEKLGNN